MMESQNLPTNSDCTKAVALDSDMVQHIEQRAISFEYKLLVKASNNYEQIAANYRGTQYETRQAQLDELYLTVCKEYIDQKKKALIDAKQMLVKKLHEMMEIYTEIRAMLLINYFVPIIKDKMQNSRPNQYSQQKLDECMRKLRLLDSIQRIQRMPRQELFKHEFLKFRIMLLEQALPYVRHLQKLHKATKTASNTSNSRSNDSDGQVQDNQNLVGKRTHAFYREEGEWVSQPEAAKRFKVTDGQVAQHGVTLEKKDEGMMELQNFKDNMATFDQIFDRMLSSVDSNAKHQSSDQTERARMEKNRAGVILSNALTQVREQIQQDSSCSDMRVIGQFEGENTGNQWASNSDSNFFQTCTDQINYKQMLGFDQKQQINNDHQDESLKHEEMADMDQMFLRQTPLPLSSERMQHSQELEEVRKWSLKAQISADASCYQPVVQIQKDTSVRNNGLLFEGTETQASSAKKVSFNESNDRMQKESVKQWM